MKTKALLTVPFAVGLMLTGAAFAQSGHGECPATTGAAPADCKPLTRAEVKAEMEAAGVKAIEVGECPNVPAPPTATGMMRTRAEVKREAAAAAASGKTVSMGECPN
ncbi:MAG: hypothetical protein R3E83_19400 [Burkholderiaceae bacterium]